MSIIVCFLDPPYSNTHLGFPPDLLRLDTPHWLYSLHIAHFTQMGYSFHSLLFLPAYYLYGSQRVGASYLIYYLFHSLHIILVNAFSRYYKLAACVHK